MEPLEALFEALEAQQPRAALQRVMQRWLEAGMERADVLAALARAQTRLRAQGQDEQADLIAELLDGFDGWCRV